MRRAATKRERLVLTVGLAAAAAALAAGHWVPVKAALAQVLLESAWRSEREGGHEVKPWPWADTTPVARLTIPSLEADWIVLDGASGRNLAFAPGLMSGGAALGEPGVAVIAGHRDTHFRALERIEAGMPILLEDTSGRLLGYRVAEVMIVDATETRLRLDAERSMLALVTCYPFDAPTAGGPLRFIVIAEAYRHASATRNARRIRS